MKDEHKIEKFFNYLRRKWIQLEAWWRLLKGNGEELNKRVEIENDLLLISKGKKPLPTKDGCRIMALKLGTPKQYWRKEWKE